MHSRCFLVYNISANLSLYYTAPKNQFSFRAALVLLTQVSSITVSCLALNAFVIFTVLNPFSPCMESLFCKLCRFTSIFFSFH